MASANTSAPNGTDAGNKPLSAAQILMQKHQEAHHIEVEDVPDEEDLKERPHPSTDSILESTEDSAPAPGWVAPMSAKAAGKQKEEVPTTKDNKPLLDTQSHELFPGLGGAPKPAQPTYAAPSWVAKKPATNGSNGISTNGTATPPSGLSTPAPTSQPALKAAPQSLAGQIQAPLLVLQKQEVLPRNQLKKPLPDILKDINKKLRTNITMKTGEGGVLEFREGSSQRDAVKQQAIRDLGAQIGAKTASRVSIPKSARAHIIGKGGSTIKSIQESSGARIQIPKEESQAPTSIDDEDLIDVIVEGNPIAIAMARKEIDKIANERSTTMTSKLSSVPAEFYPFIAGPRAEALEKAHGVQIQVPSHHTWRSQPPPQVPQRGQAPVFLDAEEHNPITLDGDRAAIRAVRAEIAQLAEELRQQLTVDQLPLEKAEHQFVIGDRGVPANEFFAKTGCSVILPGPADEETITFVGPIDKLEAAKEYAIELAGSWNRSDLDISRQHRNAPGGAKAHARSLTQYLQDRNQIEKIEALHDAYIMTRDDPEDAGTWQIFVRDNKNSIRARTEINNIITAHPPSRMSTIPIDPFFHPHFRRDVGPQVKRDYGVHMVFPHPSRSTSPVLLVFEGENRLDPEYQAPRGQPTPEEIRAFEQGLQDARNHILDLLSKQAQIESKSIDVPAKFHKKLEAYIRKEQQNRSSDEIPVRAKSTGTIITLQGPAPAVEALTTKVEAFVAQAIEDEKERDFKTSFEFPQKHANQLIGKGGSFIGELREKFDVDIKVNNDGTVELTGPKAKAAEAKAHISALGRQWADETTYVLKVEPKFHRELIGAQGAQINKLQTRYKVQIHFPRSGKPARDDSSNADAASDAGRRGPRRDQEPDEVIVKGPKKGADEARDEILSLLQYLKDTSFTEVVAVQASQIPSLIGQRGREMDEIRQTSGARIDIPNARDTKDPTTRVEIQIKGTKSQVAQAKKLIAEKRDVFDQTITKTLEVDKKYHRALIGPSGSTINNIIIQAGGSKDSNRTVQFPKAESEGNIIKIEGKADVVNKIIARIQEIVSERENQTTETVDIPTNKHRSLIGHGGETKKGLEAKFKVSIDIPKKEAAQTGIKISGLPADVEKAKTHILELIKDQEGVTIQVPRKVHQAISDNGQFFRKLRNDHQVTVDHAGQEPPPKQAAPSGVRSNGGALPVITDDADETANAFSFKTVDNSDSNIDGEIPWVLRGPSDNVVKATATLNAAIQQALKNTTTGYLILPDPTTYRYVIGSGGSKVNSIRKATGCKITVPRDKGDKARDEAIEIIGSAEGVEKAKDLILKAVKDGSAASTSGGFSGRNTNGTNNGGNWD